MDALRAVPVDGTAAALDEFWSQEIVGEANGSLFKVAKGIGSTEWHAHDDQDEVFLVTHGTLVVELCWLSGRFRTSVISLGCTVNIPSNSRFLS